MSCNGSRQCSSSDDGDDSEADDNETSNQADKPIAEPLLLGNGLPNNNSNCKTCPKLSGQVSSSLLSPELGSAQIKTPSSNNVSRKKRPIDQIATPNKKQKTGESTIINAPNSSNSNASVTTGLVGIIIKKLQFDDLPEDVKMHVLGFLNAYDYSSLLFLNKKFHTLYWKSISTLIATTPHQMDIMKTVLKKIVVEHPAQLLLIRNIGWWSAPGNIIFPVDREVMEILHLCKNVVRVIFGKGQHVVNIKSNDFQLLRSLQNLELIEIDHIELDSSAFTSPIPYSKCSNHSCSYCPTSANGSALSLIEHFPNLKSFRVRGVNCLPGESMLRQLKNSSGMKRIGIWGSGQMSDSEILSLPLLTDLTELILSSCTSSGDRSVFQVLVKMKLKHLGLFYAQNNNPGQDDDFRILSEIPSLTSLHLGGWNLTNNAFRHLDKNNNLQNLSISRAQSISREGIAEIARNINITTLRISACIFLRDYDMAPVVFMKQLQRLDLDNTKSITDNFLKFLSEKTELCEISELYLMGIPLISDRGISYLEHFRSLKTLVIKNCQNVTEVSVKKLRENHLSAWVGKLHVTLDNSEYIQKQQQQQQQLPQQHQQHQQQQQPQMQQPQMQQPQMQQSQMQQSQMQQQAPRQLNQPVTPQQLIQQLQAIELQVEEKLSQIKEQQPLQEEQGLQTAYQYQEQLQQLHNMLHNQQRIQKQLQMYQQQQQLVPTIFSQPLQLPQQSQHPHVHQSQPQPPQHYLQQPQQPPSQLQNQQPQIQLPYFQQQNSTMNFQPQLQQPQMHIIHPQQQQIQPLQQNSIMISQSQQQIPLQSSSMQPQPQQQSQLHIIQTQPPQQQNSIIISQSQPPQHNSITTISQSQQPQQQINLPEFQQLQIQQTQLPQHQNSMMTDLTTTNTTSMITNTQILNNNNTNNNN